MGLLVVALLAAQVQDEQAGIRLRAWHARMTGEVSGGEATRGTDIDLGSDLGLDDPELTPDILVFARIHDAGAISAGWWRAHREADEVLTRTIRFADQTYTGSTRVESECALDVYSLAYEHRLTRFPTGEASFADAGIQAGLRLIDAEGSLESPLASGSDTGLIVFPALGVRAGLQPVPWFRTDLELAGSIFRFFDREGTYLDAALEARFLITGRVGLGLGYRGVLLEVSDESGSSEFELDAALSGFYLSATAGF